MTIINHEIKDAPIAKHPFHKMMKVLKVLLIISGILLIINILAGGDVVGFLVTAVVLIIFIMSGWVAILKVQDKVNYSRKYKPRKAWIKAFIRSKGYNIDHETNSALIFVDEQQRQLFFTSLYENVLKQCDFSDIRGSYITNEKTVTTHKNKDNAYSHTSEQVDRQWLVLQLIDANMPEVKLQFGSAKELNHWIEKINVLMKYSS